MLPATPAIIGTSIVFATIVAATEPLDAVGTFQAR